MSTNMEAPLSQNIDLSQGYTNVELQADLSQLNYELKQLIFNTILHYILELYYISLPLT